MSPLQAPPFPHVIEQLVPPQRIPLRQELGPVHRMSDVVALVVIEPAHEVTPLHAIEQLVIVGVAPGFWPAVQSIEPPHEAVPLQVIEHDVALPQLTPPAHEAIPEQVTAQGIPSGQVGFSQPVLQAIVHVPSALHLPFAFVQASEQPLLPPSTAPSGRVGLASSPPSAAPSENETSGTDEHATAAPTPTRVRRVKTACRSVFLPAVGISSIY
jgi:hypothetical protein